MLLNLFFPQRTRILFGSSRCSNKKEEEEEEEGEEEEEEEEEEENVAVVVVQEDRTGRGSQETLFCGCID